MDMHTIATTVTGLLVAAQTGALDSATTLAAKLGKAGVDKVWELVKTRFVKDGEGAKDTLQQLAKNPKDEQAQRIVKRRLEGFLDEDPAFLAAIEAIIGEVTAYGSITQIAEPGDHSPIIQNVGNNNQFK